MLVTLHMFSLSVVCTLNTQLKLLPLHGTKTAGKRELNLTPTVGR